MVSLKVDLVGTIAPLDLRSS